MRRSSCSGYTDKEPTLQEEALAKMSCLLGVEPGISGLLTQARRGALPFASCHSPFCVLSSAGCVLEPKGRILPQPSRNDGVSTTVESSFHDLCPEHSSGLLTARSPPHGSQ